MSAKFEKIDEFIKAHNRWGNDLEFVVANDHFEWYPWATIALSVSELTGINVSSTTLRRWAKEKGWELNRDII